jgi:hypothetical protein
MAYPLVDAPYGLKPINLIGGQVFAGSTREYNIPYDYQTAIFYGDIVGLLRGNVRRLAVTSGVVGTITGVFLGCRYTNPVTKQVTFSQYWPGSVAAGDAVAIICDDPDTVFKVAICSSGTTIASASEALIGQNCAMLDNTGNVNTGNSANALASPTATPATTISLPLRVVGLVAETAQSFTAVGYTGTGGTASASTTITITSTGGLPSAVVVGADVSWIAPNGQNIATGSFITTAASAAATTATLNQTVVANSANSSTAQIPLSSTIVFTQYTEALVKLNFGLHQYYAGTAVNS